MTPAEVRAMSAPEYMAFLLVMEEQADMQRALERREERAANRG